MSLRKNFFLETFLGANRTMPEPRYRQLGGCQFPTMRGGYIWNPLFRIIENLQPPIHRKRSAIRTGRGGQKRSPRPYSQGGGLGACGLLGRADRKRAEL